MYLADLAAIPPGAGGSHAGLTFSILYQLHKAGKTTSGSFIQKVHLRRRGCQQ